MILNSSIPKEISKSSNSRQLVDELRATIWEAKAKLADAETDLWRKIIYKIDRNIMAWLGMSAVAA